MARRRDTTAAEERAHDADEAAQERAASDARTGRVSPGFVHATHPDTGVAVVFLPGELLPSWVNLPDEVQP